MEVGVWRVLGRLRSWDLQMTLQKVCYKAVIGSFIIHVRWCVNIVLRVRASAVHFFHARIQLNKEEHQGISSVRECISVHVMKVSYYHMHVCAFAHVLVHTCVAVGLMPLSPCGNPSPTLPLSIQIMPSVGKCATRQPPRSE